MQGFFDKIQIQTPYRSSYGMHSCINCGLYRNALSPKMAPYGDFEKRVLVCGEAPGSEEDEKGRPWQGRMGRMLQRKYANLGVDLFRDCVSVNAVSCRPTDKRGNRTPTDREIACCQPKVIAVIKQYQPRVIILHGGAAISSLIGMRWKGDLGGISKWRGWAIPDRAFKAWVCPTFHPSYVARSEQEGGEVEVIWTRDLRQAFAKVDEPFPNYPNEEEQVIVSDDVGGVLGELNDLSGYGDPPLLALDIEASGIKPFATDVHKIACISFCREHDRAYVIPMPEKEEHLKLLKRLLRHPKIGKVAQNMTYENNWLKALYDIDIRPWAFDTMIAAHILDNRPGVTGLKFNAFIRFGLVGYDVDVTPYLNEAKGTGGYGLNRVMDLANNPTLFRKLMIYCGIDSLATYRLARLQMTELKIR